MQRQLLGGVARVERPLDLHQRLHARADRHLQQVSLLVAEEVPVGVGREDDGVRVHLARQPIGELGAHEAVLRGVWVGQLVDRHCRGLDPCAGHGGVLRRVVRSPALPAAQPVWQEVDREEGGVLPPVRALDAELALSGERVAAELLLRLGLAHQVHMPLRRHRPDANLLEGIGKVGELRVGKALHVTLGDRRELRPLRVLLPRLRPRVERGVTG